LKKKLLENKNKNKKLNENLEKEIEINKDLNKLILELNNKIDELNIQTQILIDDQITNNKSLEGLSKLRQKLSKAISEHKNSAENNLTNIQELTELIKTITEQNKILKKKLRKSEKKNVKNNQNIQTISEENDELQEEINKKIKENSEKNNENIRLEEKINEKEKENEEKNDQNKILKEDNEKINKELETAKKKIEEYENAVPQVVVAAPGPTGAPSATVVATDTKEIEKLLLLQQQQYNDTLQGTLREFMYENQDALQGTIEEFLYKKNYEAEQQKRRESIKILKGSTLKKITESITKPKKDAKQETRNLSKALAMLGKATSDLSDSNRKTKEALAKRKTATSMR